MLALDEAITLDHTLRDLVRLRASQLNSCAYCIDVHWKSARGRGETDERLYMLGAWRQSSFYTERERAALELCEAMTLIIDRGVPDALWDDVAARFDEVELSQLVFAIAAINSWNRLSIAAGTDPGSTRCFSTT